jgi:hypothetical protein
MNEGQPFNPLQAQQVTLRERAPALCEIYALGVASGARGYDGPFQKGRSHTQRPSFGGFRAAIRDRRHASLEFLWSASWFNFE